MKSLQEYLIEASVKNQRDILFTQDGDCWKDKQGHTFTTLETALKTGQYYDVVITADPDKSVEVSCPNGLIGDLKNINCDYLISAGSGFAVKMKPVGEGETWKNGWNWSLDKAVADADKGGLTTFWDEKFICDPEFVVEQVDEFFKNNNFKHVICGSTNGKKMDGKVKYHLREIVKGGKNGYKTRPFKIESLAREFGVPNNPGSNWLVMF